MEADFSSEGKVLFISKRGPGIGRAHQAVYNGDYKNIRQGR